MKRQQKAIQLVMVMLCLQSPASARTKDKTPAAKPQDQIDVVANLPLPGGPVTRITLTRHSNQSYLYLEHASHRLTLLEVTDYRHPRVLGELDPPASSSGSILAANGDEALIAAGDSTPAPRETSLTIVSFADPGQPRTIRQFNKVTCSALDSPRGLIFLANPEGFWILHRNPASDPELQERYAHDVVYNH